ncbi:MAG: hypothetical protein K5945_07050 [Bacteroidaceae bacterium]|nr:hypothetical protein [Bacteroidaceae bacterium]
MRKRFNNWSRYSSRMMCLLASCGLLYACEDPFKLDDEKPVWLNTSIYQSLQDGIDRELDDGSKVHLTFNTYLRLLADKDVNPENVRPLSDVLDRTGSKTVFVADDKAWEEFFKKNAQLPEADPWHYATSYENLSVAQKKLLIHTSMLNNSIVMENLASSEGSGNTRPVRGEYMRRYTDVEVTDTVCWETPDRIPYSYSNVDKDYWARFRPENEGNGLYLLKDAHSSMMLHFTTEHMSKNTVTDEDFAIFMGRPRVTSDVHIYDALLREKDVVCENGYVNVTEKPLVPLANMAEVIHSNGRTNIFSHMLDRYCAPFYTPNFTLLYKNIMKSRGEKWADNDSIFVKRYFSDNSSGHRPLAQEPGPNGTYNPYMPYKDDTSKDIIPSLKFDPGWNEFRDETDVEKDMAAMFVPSDDALWTYFTQGGGLQLIETYANINNVANLIALRPGETISPEAYDALYREIDQIPLGTLQALINIIMLRSFVGSVPSKMTKLRDDAQEQLFYAEDIDKIDTCLLACNGAVYIMSDIYGPADYTSVTSPAYISTTNNIIKWAIYNGSSGTDYMGLNYYAYLKAMQSEFTFFLPSDAALQYYYDPTSFKSTSKRLIQFTYRNQAFPINSKCINYDPATGVTGRAITGQGASIQQQEITNRLKDILESHTIVHDGTNPIHGEDEYFLSKNGNAIKVARDENGTVTQVWGGFQLENQRQGISSENPGVDTCLVTKAFESLKNGQTYILNAPLIPTYRSVYSILTDDECWKVKDSVQMYVDDPYLRFYDLCEVDEELIYGCGLVDINLSQSERRSAMKKFTIFVNDNGLDYNIQFFNNYRYTAFIPTNAAIDNAIAHGLPTWDEIKADYEAHCKTERVWDAELGDSVDAPTTELATATDSLRIQAKILYLTNFIRYHFLDNSVFADNSTLPEEEWVTSSYDRDLGLFCKVHVDRVKEGGKTILRVCDDTHAFNSSTGKYDGPLNHVMIPTVGEPNVLARDIVCSSSPIGVPMSTSSKRITLDASSACVIHSIDACLNHTELGADGNHSIIWETPASAKRYLERYAIPD